LSGEFIFSGGVLEVRGEFGEGGFAHFGVLLEEGSVEGG
jgi:hypothetical protein